MPEMPRFLIDDTAGISDARVLVTHTRMPRFVGELFTANEDGVFDAPFMLGGLTISLSCTEVVAIFDWIDPPVFDPNELIPALRAALEAHWSVRE